MQLINGFSVNNLRGDIYGGLTAAIVALPLALAFGVASGIGPIAGLYGAIIVGFFAALLGGTPSQISGPTGPMTVVMAVIFVKYSDQLSIAFTIVFMGGLLQIIFGAIRIGRFINLVPFTVVSGFMSGIGCIIIIIQIAPFIGHSHPGAGVIQSLNELPNDIQNINWQAALIGMITLAIVCFSPKSIQRLIPSQLTALILGTLIVYLFFSSTPILGNIPTGFPTLQIPSIDMLILIDMIVSAVILALLGSIDSLLTSLVADNATRTHHRSDRELVGQGIGNAIAGVCGAIPGAGATMRTVVNIRAGGRTPISGITHSLTLFIIVIALSPIAAHIPHAVLAGILIKVGIDIIDWNYLRKITKAPLSGIVVMLTVLLLTVFMDLIVAVGVGIMLASLLLVKRTSDMQLANIDQHTNETKLKSNEAKIFKKYKDRILMYQIKGPIHFSAAKGLIKKIDVNKNFDVLLLDLTYMTYSDTSATLALGSIVENARNSNVELIIVGLQPSVSESLSRLGILDQLSEQHYLNTLIEALEHAALVIENDKAA